VGRWRDLPSLCSRCHPHLQCFKRSRDTFGLEPEAEQAFELRASQGYGVAPRLVLFRLGAGHRTGLASRSAVQKCCRPLQRAFLPCRIYAALEALTRIGHQAQRRERPRIDAGAK